MKSDDILKPFYEYLQLERRALLTKLDSIERVLGISPRTAELRRQHNNVKINATDNIAGIAEYKE